ncbi:MAG: hypothetical protein JSU88_01090 [Nitrospinaceae bacterium]|jgi:hypothetical protein|nr:MAG: hypothetical protein JSU88_01090 [Nitrospinaceae bacterium]
MLLFAKDITERDHKHPEESESPGLKAYMEYQRKLYPYTVVRAGLDLAYKELDDLLEYIDNDHIPPPGSSRQDYPADPDAWYRSRFPWSSAFLKMEDMHFALVVLVKAMDSFRTWEKAGPCHWPVLYDAVNNIVEVYNGLLAGQPEKARDIRLSNGVAVAFDDFINNYWPHLDFMIFSRPDHPHERHRERKEMIEEAIRNKMGEGLDPILALKAIAAGFGIDPATQALLARDPLKTGDLELKEMGFASAGAIGHYDAGTGKPVIDIDGDYRKNYSFHSPRAAG